VHSPHAICANSVIAGYIYTVTITDRTGIIDISCDPGDKVISGGAYAPRSGALRESRYNVDTDTWRVADIWNGALGGPHAICASSAIADGIYTVTGPNGQSGTVDISCNRNAGDKVIGGGGIVPKGSALRESRAIEYDTWRVAETRDGPVYWTHAICASTAISVPSQIIVPPQEIVASEETVPSGETVEDIITGFYRDYLQREPDQDGLNYWVNQYEQGMPLADIENAFRTCVGC